MGWLDHSTNNIILDAVLTDYGRQQLANTRFSIRWYALADDEVDYRLIKRYGRTVGKEKIEKNTPIFEALTNQNVAIKYRLIGKEGSTAINSIKLPLLKSSHDVTGIQLKPSKNSDDVTFTLTLGGSENLSDVSDFLEDNYTIDISDRFFTLSSPSSTTNIIPKTEPNAGDPNKTKKYIVTVTNSTNRFTLSIKNKNIDNTTLAIYGKTVGTTKVITSYMSIVGNKFGTTLIVPITYTATIT